MKVSRITCIHRLKSHPVLRVTAAALLAAFATGTGVGAQQESAPRPEVVQTPGAAKQQSAKDAGKSQISAPAQELLKQMREAYRNLKSVDLAGTIWAQTPGGTNQQGAKEIKHSFHSAFQAPNKFRHEIEDEILLGCTGRKVYAYQKDANGYIQVDAPEGKVKLEALPGAIVRMLQTQNPSLLFALSDESLESFTENMQEVSRLPDVQLDGKTYPALAMVPRRDPDHRFVWAIDPASHLVKRFSVDINPAIISERKTNEFKKSVLTEISYNTIRTGVEFETGRFDWSPPTGAKDLAAAKPANKADQLEGKPAPQFTLNNLQGKEVSLDQLKGKVVVLDFWASWCPPCTKSLPELNRLHQEKKGEGVEVFAVNVQEDRNKVEAFLKSKDLSVPVLMDKEGAVAEKFNVSAIPQTVVIGKDGEVKKVFVGGAPETLEQVRQEVESARKEQE